jgi:UDP-glucose 4-epimerase
VEHYLQLYWLNYGIRFTALRYPNVYGPRQDANGEAGVVAIFSGLMARGKQPVINGSGEQERDFVHVSDVARAGLLALECADNEIVNIGSGIGVNINTIYGLLAELTGFAGRPLYGPAKRGEVQRIFLNAQKAAHLLRWKPDIPLRAGLASTVAFFESSFAAAS